MTSVLTVEAYRPGLQRTGNAAPALCAEFSEMKTHALSCKEMVWRSTRTADACSNRPRFDRNETRSEGVNSSAVPTISASLCQSALADVAK